MNVTTENVAEGQVALTIEVETDVVDKAMNQAYHRLASKTLVPGFRKGKAPRVMIERFLGHGALLEEALQRLIPEVFSEAAKEQNITPICEPHFEVVQVEPVIIKATVDLPPVVELGSYLDIRAALTIPEITDDDVEKAIEQTRQSMATWEAVQRPLQFDDRITVDIVGTRGDEDYFTRTDYPYSVRLENPVPVEGFAASLVGMVPQEDKEFDLSFPADFDDKNLAGQSVHFKVKVNEIRGKVLPPLDDEFAKRAGAGIETLEELQKRFRAELATTGERRAKEELVDKIVDEAVAVSKVEIPPSLVEQEVHSILEDEERRYKDQRFSLSQYLTMIGKTFDQYHEELHPIAHRRIKRTLVLVKVGEAEQIKVEPAELSAEITQMIDESTDKSENLLKFFDSEQGRELVERNILNRKILRRLVEIATEGTVVYPEIASTPASVEAGSFEEKNDEAPVAEQGEQEAGEPAQG
ncbi:MAG: trigger factor [Dehalococcoidia bacterium]|nr:trigger factor [Dehalococcoidia bacterium]